MSQELGLAGVSLSLLLLIKSRNKRNQRRWWVRKLFSNNSDTCRDLLDTLRLEDGMGFVNFLRMTPKDFENLLQMVAPKVFKENTKFRNSISPTVKLATTLRYLASGDSFTSLMYTFKISKQSISVFVPEVCEAIISVLKTNIKVSENCIY